MPRIVSATTVAVTQLVSASGVYLLECVAPLTSAVMLL